MYWPCQLENTMTKTFTIPMGKCELPWNLNGCKPWKILHEKTIEGFKGLNYEEKDPVPKWEYKYSILTRDFNALQ